MNFQSLAKIEPADRYLDIFLRSSSARARDVRSELKGSGKNRLVRSRKIEIARIEAFGKYLIGTLDNIVRSYPDFDSLPDFYRALVECTLDVNQLKKSLAAVNWVRRQVQQLYVSYRSKVKANKETGKFNEFRTAFFGRACSMMHQIASDFLFLEEARKVLKRFPALKTSYFTVVIAGAPNVGKSTLLAALSGSKPEISYYPFTTKHLNFGTDKVNRIQYVDTPGLLDRPLSERNEIERQAIIALKYLANLIIYVFDPSEGCGYPLDSQKALLAEIKNSFSVPIICVSNKADLGTASIDALPVSAKGNVGIDELRGIILSSRKGWTQ